MVPFQPLLCSPHLQTIAAHFWRRPDASVEFPVERRLYRTAPDVQVLVCTQRPRDAHGELLLVHGLEGSGEAGYIRSLSTAAVRAGFAVHRFHMRTCGGTERLCQTLYHGGLTSDLLAVLRDFRREGRPPAFLVGYSLGGNVVLKLAGEMGTTASEYVKGVCTVSAPLDLAACARRIGQQDNFLYEARFVRAMRKRMCATGRYQNSDFEGIRSVLELDDRFTAPAFGFGNAASYYRSQSAIRYLEGLRVPALLIQAKDDTFVPFDVYESDAVRCNPWIRLIATRYGGHLGFIGRRPHRLWSDEVIMEWITSVIVKKCPFASSEA